MKDTLKIVRGTYASLISKINNYPEFSPVFATDRRQFYIKYQNSLQQIIGSGGAVINEIVFDRTENGIHYYNAIMSDGRKISFPFEFKFDTTKISSGELVRMKSDGTIENSGIIYNEAKGIYESRYDFQFPSDSIWIGEALKIGQSGGFAYNKTLTTGKYYFFLDYEDDKLTGSKAPIWYKRGELVSRQIIQPDKSKLLENVNGLVIHKPNADRQVQAIYLLLQNTVKNLRMEFLVNGTPIHYYPSKLAWIGEENGYDLVVSDSNINTGVKISLFPFFSSLMEYDIHINLRGDSPINLLGNDTGLPYYELDYNPITKYKVITGLDSNNWLQTDLSNVQLNGLDEKIRDTDTGKSIPTIISDVSDVKREVNRLSTISHDVYTYRNRGVPILDTSKNYRQYYLTTTVLRNSNGTFTFPSNAEDGTTLAFENEDKVDSINLLPNTGDTIDGKTILKSDGSTFHFFVKIGNDWKLAYGGIFPNNLLSLKSTIQSLLPNQLNTIDEITESLKDRLHTFRAIQREFTDRLHTMQEIDEEMVKRGFLKTAEQGGGIKISDGIITGDAINDISLDGIGLQVNNNKAILSSSLIWKDGDNITKGNIVKTIAPLQSYSDPNVDSGVILELAHSALSKPLPDGYYATLEENEEIIGVSSKQIIKKGKIWFPNTIVGNGSYIQVDKIKKEIGIQENDNLDPLVSEGTKHLVVFRIHMKGNAPEDGEVAISLKDSSGNYLTDVNGKQIYERKDYKKDDVLNYIEITKIINAKGMKIFHMEVEHTFTQDILEITDRTDGLSCIMIQALHPNYKTGIALLQYCIDSGESVLFDSHYNGEDVITVNDHLQKDYPLSEGDIGQGQDSIDGLHFYNSTKMKIGISDGVMTFEDNGIDEVFFNFGKILSAEKTAMLRGKELKISTTLENQEGAFLLAMVEWRGNADKYTHKVISDYSNDTYIFEPSWSFVQSLPISKNVGEFHTESVDITVPQTASNIGIILLPQEKKYPVSMKLSSLKADVKVPFDYYIIRESNKVNEIPYRISDLYGKFSTGLPFGLGALRYTVNKDETKLPWGDKNWGLIDIVNDHSWTTGSDLSFEGDGLINKDMRLTIYDAKVRVYPGGGIPKDGSTLFHIYFAKKQLDGTFLRIDDSLFEHRVKSGDEGKEFVIKDFSIDVAKGDILRIIATNDINDGAYLYTSDSSKPLLSFKVKEEEVIEDLTQIKANIARIDADLVFTKEAIENGVYIEVDYNPITKIPTMSTKLRGGGK